MYEQQRDQLMAQQFNIDQTSFMIDSIQDTQTSVAAMKHAHQTIKAEQKKLNLNDIDNLQDELEEMMWDMEEVNEVLGRSVGDMDFVDDSELEAELALLEDDLLADEEGVEEGGLPEYLQTGFPQQPSTVPVNARPVPTTNTVGEEKVDEFGLPMDA